ncbi:MAG: hypothetical protein QOG46_2507 [Pseudonocardiales bacterium]|nr:hypothetical protein [Pseudonocardiales bacterium]
MGALAYKVDLPKRVKGKGHDAKETAQSKLETVKQHLQTGTEALQDKADGVMQEARGVTNQALAKLVPEGVGRIRGQRMKRVTGTVRRRPVPAAAAVLSVLMLVGLIIRRSR